MKKILITIALLLLFSVNVQATENNGVGEVKTGFKAVLTSDNDGDGIKDRDDLCKDTAITPTHVDSDLDGCDDNMTALIESLEDDEQTAEQQTGETVEEQKKPTEDADGDGLEDSNDGCIYYAPTIDENENGCQDDTIRTMYVTNFADNSSFSITGIAFVDGQKFDDAGDYKTEVEFHNLETGEHIPGKVATNFCDERINVVVEGSVKNIECSAFTATFDADDFENVSKAQDDTKYSVDITLTDSKGQKYTETLYSDDDDFNGNNSGCVRVAAEEHRVYLTIK